MWGVISYYTNEAGKPDLWLYKTKEKAIKGMRKLWEDCFNEALNDIEYAEDGCYHDDKIARVSWVKNWCGEEQYIYRYFEVVKQNERETI